MARLNHDIHIFADALPPDPRGTSPGIRAATLRNVDGSLDYRILLIQDEDNRDTTFRGEMQLIAAGRYSSGKSAHVPLEPFDIEMDHYRNVEGRIELPDHFTAREVTIQIKKEGQDKVTATRTIIASR